jgi:glycerate kinase
VRRDLGIDVTGWPAMGAAGGTAAGIVAVLGPATVSVVAGARLVCELIGLGETLGGADLVITGEGSLDGQTLHGKAPAEVATRARAAGVPCLALAGVVALGREALTAAGFTAAHALTEVEADVARCLAEPERLLAQLAALVVPRVVAGG